MACGDWAVSNDRKPRLGRRFVGSSVRQRFYRLAFIVGISVDIDLDFRMSQIFSVGDLRLLTDIIFRFDGSARDDAPSMYMNVRPAARSAFARIGGRSEAMTTGGNQKSCTASPGGRAGV